MNVTKIFMALVSVFVSVLLIKQVSAKPYTYVPHPSVPYNSYNYYPHYTYRPHYAPRPMIIVPYLYYYYYPTYTYGYNPSGGYPNIRSAQPYENYSSIHSATGRGLNVGDEVIDSVAEQKGSEDLAGRVTAVSGSSVKVRYDSGVEKWRPRRVLRKVE